MNVQKSREPLVAESASSADPIQDPVRDLAPRTMMLEELRDWVCGWVGSDHRPLERILQEDHFLDEAGIRRYQLLKGEIGQSSMGRELAKSNLLPSDQYAAAFCKSVGLPFIRIRELVPEQEALAEIPYSTAIAHTMFPLCIANGNLVVAIEDPSDAVAINAASFGARYPIVPVGALGAEIGEQIERYYEKVEFQQLVHSVNVGLAPRAGESSTLNLERAANQQPVVQLVSSLINRAIKQGASDINIRPAKDAVMVYYRLDGQMKLVHRLNLEILPALTSRIKIIANMDIAEHRLPQDGHVSVRFMGRDVDLRVSIMPTVGGESTVIRVLDQSKTTFSIGDLQMHPEDEQILNQLINHNNGIFLVTGPTGSGKSTTLYAVVSERKQRARHIITVEDPVEYHIDGIEQIQVRPKIGYTFAEALRHILRHDPDDVLIGEMRDRETAEIAVKASLTGHFVMSTLHTNDAVTAITRLVDMGIEPYLIATSLVGVLAQRLVRTLCTECRIEHYPRPNDLAGLEVPKDAQFYRPNGCHHCHGTGYHGRVMVCELFGVSHAIRRMISNGSSVDELRAEVRKEGRRSLFDHALTLVVDGKTSLDEALCVKVS